MFYDKNIDAFNKLKAMSLEEFKEKIKSLEAEKIYRAVQKSQDGRIKIKKDGTNDYHWGYTPGFGEGISCYMATNDRWYSTSIIKQINWDEGYFITLNSKYWFTFVPYEDVEQEEKEEKKEDEEHRS